MLAVFEIFNQPHVGRPDGLHTEKKWIDSTREKLGHASDIDILQKTFDRMK